MLGVVSLLRTVSEDLFPLYPAQLDVRYGSTPTAHGTYAIAAPHGSDPWAHPAERSGESPGVVLNHVEAHPSAGSVELRLRTRK